MKISSVTMTGAMAAESAASSGDSALDEWVADFASFLGSDVAETGVRGAMLHGVGDATRVTIQGESVELEAANVETKISGTASSQMAESAGTVNTAELLPAKAMPDRSLQVEHTTVVMKGGGASRSKAAGAALKGMEGKPSDVSPAGMPSTVEALKPTPVVVASNASPPWENVQRGPSYRPTEISTVVEQGSVAEFDASAEAMPRVAAAKPGVTATGDKKERVADPADASAPVTIRDSLASTSELSAKLQPSLALELAGWRDSAELQETPSLPNVSPQKKINVLPAAADKTYIPAEPTTTIGSSLLSDPSQVTANQQSFYSVNRGEREPSTPESIFGVVSGPAGTVVAGGSSVIKSDTRQEITGWHLQPTDASISSNHVSGPGAGTSADPESFGTTLPRDFHLSGSGEHVPEGVSSDLTFVRSGEFVMEHRQTVGAARSLGDALQSTMGLGVQTESFGRVTIHTATEGNHLLAQVVLEDGRQSATLLSHVPAVEQRLKEQLGLETSVNVSTGSHSSSGEDRYGGSHHDAPQQRRDQSESDLLHPATIPGSQSGEVPRPVPWIQGPGRGRLDVTV